MPPTQHLSHIPNYWPMLKALAHLRLHHLICLIPPSLGNPRLPCFSRPFLTKRKCVADDSTLKHRWVYWERHIRLVDVCNIYFVRRSFKLKINLVASTVSPKVEANTHISGANIYRQDSHTSQSQFFDLDLDLNPDL